MTIYALFGDDFRQLVTTKGADPTFNVITIVVMVLFLVEITLSSIVVEDYFLSLYFFLDLLATITMITDVTWIWDKVVGNNNFLINDAQSASNFIRASRGARIGARVSRLSRVMRLVRLLRVVRIYKKANSAVNKLNDSNEFKRLVYKHKKYKNMKQKA